jgi:medium-chain acyl-[acyl-carrier-protein] hydrolase
MTKLSTLKEFEVNYYEIDFRKRLLITSLINYFEDTAIKQSQDLGRGLDYMEKSNSAWVLFKWDIHIKRYPGFREKIKVTTIPYSLRKFYGYRSFIVVDEKENEICSANSAWLLMDTEKRRAKRITDDMYRVYGLTREDDEFIDIENIHLPDNFTTEKIFNVRYSDIDTNRHVNNVKYIDWAIETMPSDIMIAYSMKNIKITYKKEATYGEKVKSSSCIVKKGEEYVGIHLISNLEGEKLCLLETVWEKFEP